MTARQSTIALAAYALIAVVTFGHAATRFVASERQDERECRSDPQRHFCALLNDEGMAPIVGMFSAAAWPLYWSWEAFDAD